MSYSNFTNGAIVVRIWRFDGSAEVLAKFQYRGQADAFCEMMVATDKERGSNKDGSYFYVSLCESENHVQAFGAKHPEVQP